MTTPTTSTTSWLIAMPITPMTMAPEKTTTVSVYSLRARERPTVSTPLSWEEVEAGDPEALVFEAEDVLERVEQHGDLFEPVVALEQELPEL